MSEVTCDCIGCDLLEASRAAMDYALHEEPAINRAPTKRYAELPAEVKLAHVNACPQCISQDIGDFDMSEYGDNRQHLHCWTCGRVWLKVLL